MTTSHDVFPQQPTVDLAERVQPPLGSFRGSTEIPVPDGWRVEGAEVNAASPFFAAVDVRYVTPEGPDQKDLLLRRPSAAVVATRTNPESKAREMLVVKQLRHGAGREVLELPAGMTKKGETLADAAVRETREESGVVIELDELGEPHVLHRDPARSPDLEVHQFHIEVPGDTPTKAPVAEDGEHVTGAAWVPMRELYGMLENGEIYDMSLAAAVGQEATKELRTIGQRLGQIVSASQVKQPVQ